MNPPVCSGSLPHASLEPKCIRNPLLRQCEFKCSDGYRESDVEDVMFIRGNWPKQVICMDGMWATYLHINGGIGFHDICLPEGTQN